MTAEGSLPPSTGFGRELEEVKAVSPDHAELVRLHAFNRCWEDCRVSFRAYLSSFVPDPTLVEDCLQELAIVAWQKSPLDRGHQDFLAYGLACAWRIGQAAIRRNKIGRMQLLAPDVMAALADTVRGREQASEPAGGRLAALRSCLASLDDKQRQLLEARYSGDEGAVLKDEARRLGRSPDSLYKQLERLRIALRDCISKRIHHME
ncbi:hypothetical protein KBB96_09830 [Luteolibacter ambystomatis]|uniref:Sigma-70 family RNA polymerase sigma factor n=1 Tax=Luteolibacter ambystomatis TaxID=2824561 RepID=A0A975J350_9BACT|nr:hypothetical protein [Luteolibacter ambystomatis]QUE53180.1 hypothetical protein KBB96_09830 [Luteolibacter ambystomatis]